MLDPEDSSGYNAREKDLNGAVGGDDRCKQTVSIGHLWREMRTDPETRTPFFASLAIVALGCLELGLAGRVSSLGLATDAVRLCFLACVLFTAVLSTVLCRRSPTLAMSYGWDRAEVLALFSFAIFFLFTHAFMAMEAVYEVWGSAHAHGGHNRDHSHHDHAVDAAAGAAPAPAPAPASTSSLRTALFLAGLATAAVRVGVTLTFRSGTVGLQQRNTACLASRAEPRATAPSASRLHAPDMMQAVAAELSCSAALVLAAGLATDAQLARADAVAAILAFVVALKTLLPLAKATGITLMQARPGHERERLEKALRAIADVDGLLEARSTHFWMHAPGVLVGSIAVRVQRSAREQDVLAAVHRICSPVVTHLTIQVEKDPDLEWLMRPSGNGASFEGAHQGHGHSHSHGHGH